MQGSLINWLINLTCYNYRYPDKHQAKRKHTNVFCRLIPPPVPFRAPLQPYTRYHSHRHRTGWYRHRPLLWGSRRGRGFNNLQRLLHFVQQFLFCSPKKIIFLFLKKTLQFIAQNKELRITVVTSIWSALLSSKTNFQNLMSVFLYFIWDLKLSFLLSNNLFEFFFLFCALL